VAPQAAAQDDRYTIEVAGREGWLASPVRQPRTGHTEDIVVTLRQG